MFLTVVRIYITNHPVTPANAGEGIIHGVMRTYAVWPPCRRSRVNLNHASHCHLRGRTLVIVKSLTSLFSIMFFKMSLKKYKRISHFKITRIRFSMNLSANKHQKKKRRNEGREGDGQGEREGRRGKRQDQNNSQSFTYFKGGITNRLSFQYCAFNLKTSNGLENSELFLDICSIVLAIFVYGEVNNQALKLKCPCV